MVPPVRHPYVVLVRVLICDDEPDIRFLFRTEFEDVGAEVFEAVDGDDCITQVAACCPDLVVLDLYMPNRDGLSALPDIKRSCPGTVVVVVSAHGASEIFNQSRARGATACFGKLEFTARIPRLAERYGGAVA
jgi:CheY-like chemotaxis protein